MEDWLELNPLRLDIFLSTLERLGLISHRSRTSIVMLHISRLMHHSMNSEMDKWKQLPSSTAEPTQ